MANVIDAVPGLMPVTVPSEDTVATDPSDVVHVPPATYLSPVMDLVFPQ